MSYKTALSASIALLTTNVAPNIIELLGGYDKILSLLVMLATIDYITGVAKAIKEKKLNNNIGFWGGVKKIGLFCLIAIAHKLDSVLPADPVFRTLTILFLISNESISVFENLGALGVPIPKVLKEKFLNLRGDEDERCNKLSVSEESDKTLDSSGSD